MTTSCLLVGSAGGAHRAELERALSARNCNVVSCSTLDAAQTQARETGFDLVVLDRRDEWIDASVMALDWVPSSAVFVTGGPDQVDATRALAQAGAVGFANEPADPARLAEWPDQLAQWLAVAARARCFETECARLWQQVCQAGQPDELFVGRSPVMRRLDGAIRRAAEIDATVLIEGAAGTGKSLIARTLHFSGRRSDGPLVAVTASTLTEELLIRAFEDARDGTLLIEYIESMAQPVQSRLVRHLKERSSRDESESRQDARLVVTTTGKLAEFTSKGTFREDLYYRLNTYPMQLPLLRERVDDIAELASRFLEQAAGISGQPSGGISPAALILLETNPWPGNVAQLRNVIYRAHVVAGRKVVDRVHLIGPVMGVQAPLDAPDLRGAGPVHSAIPVSNDEVTEADILPFQEEEKRILTRALKAAKGNVRQAAELLGIGRATLYRKIQVFELSLS